MTHRILVADDSPTIQKVIRIAFSRMEVEMIGASSYVEAVSEAARSQPSLVIVDAGLPGTRGPSDFSKLKSSSGNVPIVLLVGSYENIDEPAFLAAGLEIIVRKPFDSADLVRTCATLLDSRKPASMPQAPTSANLPPPPRMMPTPAAKNTSAVPEFDLGEETGKDMFRVTSTDAAARQAPANPTSARDIDLEQAIGSLGIPVIDMGSESSSDDLTPAPVVETARRGQKAFAASVENTGSGTPNAKPAADSRSSQHPATKTHYIPPPSSGGRGPTISQPPASKPVSQPPIAAAPQSMPQPENQSSQSPQKNGIAPEELARLVRESVEDFCSRHFSGLAREIITAELRRLADERARHLVDN